MPVLLTCPACAASFTPADDLRGKKAFCPRCGASLIVTSAGVAKGNEAHWPVPARGFNPLWLLLPLLLLLLLVPAGLTLYLFTRGHADEPKQVVKNEDQPPPPALNHQNPSDDPSATRKKEPGPGKAPPPDKGLRKDDPILVPPIKPRPLGPPTFRVRQTATLTVKDFFVYSLAFSPDGKTLAGGGWWFPDPNPDPNGKGKGQIRLWDVANLKNTKKTMTGTVDNGCFSLSFSLDGKLLVCLAGLNDVMLWNATTGENINTFNAPKGTIDGGVEFSRDGKTVVVRSSPPVLWDVSTGKATTLPANPGLMTFSLDGRTGVTAGQAKDGKTRELKLWNVAEGKSTATLTPALPVTWLVFSADGKTLFSGEYEGTGTDFKCIVEVWDVARGKKTGTVSVDTTGGFQWWGFSADGKMLATATTPRAVPAAETVKLWDLASGKVVAELGHTSNVFALAFSRDGTKVGTFTFDRTVHLWELTRGNGGTPNEK